MIRNYTEQNVYDALQNRLRLLFEEFDNIFVSFSGGKDSGLLLNLTLDFQRKYYPHKKIGVFHQDFEAQYQMTTDYVARTFARIAHEVELYWVCLPMATRTALSSYGMCCCILKNDHICRFMGFGLTREQQKRNNALKEKYSKVGE